HDFATVLAQGLAKGLGEPAAIGIVHINRRDSLQSQRFREATTHLALQGVGGTRPKQKTVVLQVSDLGRRRGWRNLHDATWNGDARRHRNGHAAGQGAHYSHDFIELNELFRRVNASRGISLRISVHQFDLASERSASRIELLRRQDSAVLNGLAVSLQGSSEVEQGANFYWLGGTR